MIYADNAATTQMSKAAISAMLNCMEETWGNPSSLYGLGQRAKEILEDARERIAACIGASPKEITFTSGGSEADNQAIRSAALLGAQKGKRHIISTAFEHHAVLHTLKKLEGEGFEVELLPVGELGTVTAQQVSEAIREDTALVTIMYANNEIGSVLPISEIGPVCRERGVLFHTDAVQAAGHLPIDVKAQNIDMLSLSAHKFHGPKGIGVLYARRGISLTNLIEGGAQERGKRAGRRNGECTGHHGYGGGAGGSLRPHGGECREGIRPAGQAHRGAVLDSPCRPQRGPGKPSPRQRELLL